MSQLSFDHLLNLSLAFHTKRKTGEVLRVLDRGAAINHVFEVLLFNIIPTLFDIVVALGAFFYFFGWALCLLIAVVMTFYSELGFRWLECFSLITFSPLQLLLVYVSTRNLVYFDIPS